jgi:hypothetical protein
MSKLRNLRESSGAEEGQGTAGQAGGGYGEVQGGGRGRAELGGGGEQLVRAELVGGKHGAARRGLLRGGDGVMLHCGGRRCRSGAARRQGAAGGGWAEPYGDKMDRRTGGDFDHLGPY